MVVLGPGVFVLGISSAPLTTMISSAYSVATVVTVVPLPFFLALDDFLLMEMFVVPRVSVLVSLFVLGIVTVV